MILPAVRTGQSFILAVCTSASGCLSVSILIGMFGYGCFLMIRCVTVGDLVLVDESVSESSDLLGCGCGDDRGFIRFEL